MTYTNKLSKMPSAEKDRSKVLIVGLQISDDIVKLHT